MSAFMNLGDSLPGEATDKGHDKWIIVQSVSAPVYRTIPEGAKDQQRTKGTTTLGDVIVVRDMDKSSVKLQEACANGTFFDEVEIRLCTTVKDKQQPYLKYKLSNCIISSYSFHGNSDGDPVPSEQISLGFTKAEWTYVTVDPKTGDPRGSVVGSYDPGKGAK